MVPLIGLRRVASLRPAWAASRCACAAAIAAVSSVIRPARVSPAEAADVAEPDGPLGEPDGFGEDGSVLSGTVALLRPLLFGPGCAPGAPAGALSRPTAVRAWPALDPALAVRACCSCCWAC